MAVLPKGVYIQEHRTKAGKVVRYQAKAMIDGVKYSKVFDTVEDAKFYLVELRSINGRKALTERELAEKKSMEEFRAPSFEFFFDAYFDYKYPEAEFFVSLMKKKQYRTYESFFKTIKNTKVRVFNKQILKRDPQAVQLMVGAGFKKNLSKEYKFGGLKLHEITYKTINEYIKTRCALGKSLNTVKKEVSIISCFYDEAKHIEGIAEDFFETIGNPTRDIDKSLLDPKKFKQTKKLPKRIDDDNFEKIKNCIYNEDIDFAYALLLQYYGAFRMSEAIYLVWENIDFEEKTISLPQTKTNPRVVFMTKDLQDLLETIEPDETKRHGLVLKTQTYYKYQKQMQRFRTKYEFDLVTHQLRKEAISRMISNVGKDNSIVLAEILGFTNVKNFEANYIQQEPNLSTVEGVMRNIGHTEKSKNITRKVYFALKYKPQTAK